MGEPKSHLETLIDQKAKLVSSMGFEFEEHLIENAKQQGPHGELSFIFKEHPMHDYYEKRLQYHCQKNQSHPTPQSKGQPISKEYHQSSNQRRSRSRERYQRQRKSSTPSSSSQSRSTPSSSSRSSSSSSSQSRSSSRSRSLHRSPQKQQRQFTSRNNNFGKSSTDNLPQQIQKTDIKLNELSIGQVLSMLKQTQKTQNSQSKDFSRAFYPYQVLNPNTVNHKIIEKIKQARPSMDALDALDDFLDYFKQFNSLPLEEQQSLASDKYNGGKDYKSLKVKSIKHKPDDGKLRIQDEEDEAQDIKMNYNQKVGDDFHKTTLLKEMGIGEDGAAIGGSMPERRGLGAQRRDAFEQYRQSRSNRYHVAAEERSKGIREEDLCYICQKAGHFAKDCKYGIN